MQYLLQYLQWRMGTGNSRAAKHRAPRCARCGFARYPTSRMIPGAVRTCSHVEQGCHTLLPCQMRWDWQASHGVQQVERRKACPHRLIIPDPGFVFCLGMLGCSL